MRKTKPILRGEFSRMRFKSRRLEVRFKFLELYDPEMVVPLLFSAAYVASQNHLKKQVKLEFTIRRATKRDEYEWNGTATNYFDGDAREGEARLMVGPKFETPRPWQHYFYVLDEYIHNNWKERLVCLSVHEMWHFITTGKNQDLRELDCETTAKAAVEAWRKIHT